MQMKTIIKYYFIPTSMAVIKDGKNKHGGKYASGKIKRCTLEGSRQTGHTVVTLPDFEDDRAKLQMLPFTQELHSENS